jgi:replicative DNA helicase
MKRQIALPHSEEAERAVLGALLLEPLRIAQVRTHLEPRDWFLERHRVLYQAFLEVAGAGSTPDLLTLQAHLQQARMLDKVGGPAYLATLDLDLPDMGRLDEYVAIVKERSVRRDLIADVRQTLVAAASTARPVHELLADLRGTADGLLGRAARTRWESAGAVLDRLLAKIEEQRSEALCGLTSGFSGWDQLGPGFLSGGLYVIAGRPGMGKTSLALDLTRHVAVELKRPVGVFSLEMRSDEIGLKLGADDNDLGVFFVGMVGDRLDVRVAQRICQRNLIDIRRIDRRLCRKKEPRFQYSAVITIQIGGPSRTAFFENR